jgi:hypothetical protein
MTIESTGTIDSQPTRDVVWGVLLNSRYAHQLVDGVLAIRLPAGHWAVKVRMRDIGWVAFATPRRGTVAAPFDIGSGFDRDAVLAVARQWATSARTLGMDPHRVVFAGLADATEETDLGPLAGAA